MIENVLGSQRAENSRALVENMLESFDELNVHMSLKIHFMHHHLDRFLNQISTESDEQGERFQQVALPFEQRFKSKRLDSLVADICWWSQVLMEDEEDDE